MPATPSEFDILSFMSIPGPWNGAALPTSLIVLG